MSIRGIDAQMMITRSPDFVRDASAMQKKPEMMQEHLAAAQKINDAQDQTKVSKTAESGMEKIRADDDGGTAGGYGGGGGGSEESEDEQGDRPDSGLYVAPGNNTIDITI